MADFTASTGLRDLLATSAAAYYYYVTLHGATGGFLAADTYTAGIRGELVTGTGYVQGSKVLVGTVAGCATTSASASITLTNASAIVSAGQTVSGTGIAGGTTVSSVSGNTITLSAAATATGTVTLTFGTMTNTGGVLDCTDAIWTASGGSIGPASYAAIWVNSTASITGAKLLCVKDRAATPQTATDGQTMTAGIANPITIPTPA